jgi:hypothetical protein
VKDDDYALVVHLSRHFFKPLPAETAEPRAYYQGLSAILGYAFTPNWSLTANINANFTTLDGQIDKRQEDTVVEAAGVNPSVGLAYASGAWSPWFFNVGGTALLDSASRREGYKGLMSASFGGNWNFFNQHLTMTHSFFASELINTYEYSSAGSANPGTSLGYNWNNSIKLNKYLNLGAGFGIKQTRYLDGYWDYAYNTTLSMSWIVENWSMSLSTTNGGFTDDGRVALWYLDDYRRLISCSMAYQF